MSEDTAAGNTSAALAISVWLVALVIGVSLAFADGIEVLVKSEDRAPDDSGELFLLDIPVQREGSLAFSTLPTRRVDRRDDLR